MPPKMPDMGIFTEGIVELDPMSGRYLIRTIDAAGHNVFIDVQERLAQYTGQEVRFIVTPFETIAQLAEMVEEGEIQLEQVSNKAS